MTINAINGKAFTGLSAVDGKAVSALSHVDGFPIEASGPVAGYVLWLKADAIVGLSDGDPVTTWVDSSGNGNDATQSTSGSKPTYVASSLNFLPSVYFDGTDDFMTLVSAVATGACTIFVVARNTGQASSDARPILGSTAGSNRLSFTMDRNTAGFLGLTGASSSSVIRNSFWIQGNVTKAGGGASSPSFRVNQASAGSASGAGDTSSGANTIGDTSGSSNWIGEISELIVYPSVLSGGDITIVEDYLEAKYIISDTRQLWLQADAITGKVDNDSVTTWLDLSGKANHFSSTGFTAPIYKTNIQNSLPVLRFTAASTGMKPNAQSLFALWAFDYTIYIVYSYRSASSTSTRAINGINNNWLMGPYNNVHTCYSGGFSTGLAVTQNVFVGQWVVGSGTTNTNHVNNTTYNSGGADKVSGVALSSAGGTNELLNGDIAEIIIESIADSGGQQTTTWTYLQNKWNL